MGRLGEDEDCLRDLVGGEEGREDTIDCGDEKEDGGGKYFAGKELGDDAIKLYANGTEKWSGEITREQRRRTMGCNSVDKGCKIDTFFTLPSR